MTWVKICGITSDENAGEVAAANPSAIGLNFYKPSPRYVSLDKAARIRQVVGEASQAIEVIGVFVNAGLVEIQQTVKDVGLTGIQLHGDEGVEELQQVKQRLDGVSVCKAFRVGKEGMAEVRDYLQSCRIADCLPDRILVDARVAGVYGGSGETVDWGLVASSNCEAWFPPLILAGGLTVSNVKQAIEIATPWGVDTASGVESADGKKDSRLVKQFVAFSRSLRKRPRTAE